MNFIILIPYDITQIPIIHIRIDPSQFIHLIKQQLNIINFIMFGQRVQKVPSQLVLKLC